MCSYPFQQYLTCSRSTKYHEPWGISPNLRILNCTLTARGVRLSRTPQGNRRPITTERWCCKEKAPTLKLRHCMQSSSAELIQNLKDPDDTAPFSSLGPALLQMIYSYYGVFAWKASHSQHYNHTPELSRSRGEHRCNTRLGGWTQINIKERNRVLLYASQTVTFPIAVTCCGSCKNMHAYVSVLHPRCHMSILSLSSLIFIFL